MKKIITVFLALAVILSLAICASADEVVLPNATFAGDKTQYSAGDEVVVTVTLDETVLICQNTTVFLCEVNYDEDYLTYSSHTPGDGYKDILSSNMHSSRNHRVQIGYVSVSAPAVPVELPAGTIVTVVFTAKADIANLEDAVSIRFGASAASGTASGVGHGAVEVVGAKEATCTDAGYTGDKKCTVCDVVIENGTEIPALGHSYGEWVETKAPTCTDKGEKTQTCSVCGDKKTEEIPALGHSYGEWVETKAPTCTDKGEKTQTCSVCGDVKKEEIPALGHDVEWTVTKEPTCTEPGVKTGTCKNCGETVTEEIPALGHDVEWTVTKEPTCTEKGEKTGTCKRCGVTVTEEIDALGHDYKDGVCQNCGEKDPNYVPPTTKPEKDDVPDTGDSIGVVVALLAVSALTVAFAIKRKENE